TFAMTPFGSTDELAVSWDMKNLRRNGLKNPVRMRLRTAKPELPLPHPLLRCLILELGKVYDINGPRGPLQLAGAPRYGRCELSRALGLPSLERSIRTDRTAPPGCRAR